MASNGTESTGPKNPDPRPHLNLVFIGHVDAGKSTTCGNIMVLSDLIDQRTIQKFEQEAKEKNRESWFLAYILDTNDEERSKGITVEVGRAQFETRDRRFTILDAPGHKNYVPNMISGAAQADVGVLLISARKGEFETGFERGGQTREHAMLAKTLGINKLIVAVNKMDDSTVEWSKVRYDEIVDKLKPFLRGCGFNIKSTYNVTFLPISGLKGENLKHPPKAPGSEWTQTAGEGGMPIETLFQILDHTNPPERNKEKPLRMPILDGFKDMGVMVMGKIEQGQIKPGMQCVMMPNKVPCEVVSVYIEDDEYTVCLPGENVRVKLKGIEEDQVQKGFVLAPISHPCPVVSEFMAKLFIVELLDHRPIMTAGYECVFHCHTSIEECTISKLVEVVDKTSKKKKKNPRFVKSNCMVQCVIDISNPVCLDEVKNTPQLGRFTIRDEGKTIAIGKITMITPDKK